MKTYKTGLIILIAWSCISFTLTSCFDLDEKVYSEITEESFTPSEQDVVALVASAYTPLGVVFDWQGLFDNQEEPADVIITPVRPNGWDDGGTYQRMHKHAWTAEQWQPWNIYLECYTGINNANRVKDQIEAGELPLGDNKDATITELRAIRALWYSILLDTHGNVPIVTSFTDEVPTQATRQDVYDFVVSELTDVINSDLLSKEANAETYGRMNQWAAYMTLMRVYLNAEVYTGTPQWSKALECANAVIGSKLYSLSADYSDNFKVDLGASNKEVIFAVPYDDIYYASHVFNQSAKWYPPVARNHFGWSYQTWGGSCANPQFINSYDPQDERLEKTWLSGPMYAYDNNEELVWTCLNYLPSLTCKNDAGQSMTSIDYGYRVNKYEQDLETSFYWANDFPYFRYAEALLTKAECLLRLGQDQGTAVGLVNEIRARVNAPSVTLEDLEGDTQIEYGLVGWGSLTYDQWEKVTNGETTWDELGVEGSQPITPSGNDAVEVPLGGLYDEWGWEFACEAQRRIQMIRFGTYSTKNWFNHTAIGDKHTQIFPIPLDELNSNPNLTQNPGY